MKGQMGMEGGNAKLQHLLHSVCFMSYLAVLWPENGFWLGTR